MDARGSVEGIRLHSPTGGHYHCHWVEDYRSWGCVTKGDLKCINRIPCRRIKGEKGKGEKFGERIEEETSLERSLIDNSHSK